MSLQEEVNGEMMMVMIMMVNIVCSKYNCIFCIICDKNNMRNLKCFRPFSFLNIYEHDWFFRYKNVDHIFNILKIYIQKRKNDTICLKLVHFFKYI